MIFTKRNRHGADMEEEILSMVNEGHEQGVLAKSEAEMISNIFEYSEKEAQDVMTHRNHIVALDASTTLNEAIGFVLNQHYSRFPVYQENIDHIVGVLHLKDLLRASQNIKLKNKPIGQIRKLLRKPNFVTETKSLDDILKMMQATKTQMFLVIDEYGQTSGLIALEDILEEIVGNIQDEYDVDNDFIKIRSDDEYVIDGLTPLDEVEDMLGIEFVDEPYETMNGFMIYHLQRIPKDDEVFEFEYQGYLFRILKVKNKMVDSVLVKRFEDKVITDKENIK